MQKNVRDQKKVLADDDEPLIPPHPINPPMTGFFPLEDDSDHTSTRSPEARRPKTQGASIHRQRNLIHDWF